MYLSTEHCVMNCLGTCIVCTYTTVWLSWTQTITITTWSHVITCLLTVTNHVILITRSRDTTHVLLITRPVAGACTVAFNNTTSGVSMKQDVIIMENIFYNVTPSAVYDLKVHKCKHLRTTQIFYCAWFSKLKPHRYRFIVREWTIIYR